MVDDEILLNMPLCNLVKKNLLKDALEAESRRMLRMEMENAAHISKPSTYKGFVRSDTMEPLKNPVDGKIYSSKAAYQRELKARGYHVKDYTLPKREIAGDYNCRNDLREAIQQVEGRRGI